MFVGFFRLKLKETEFEIGINLPAKPNNYCLFAKTVSNRKNRFLPQMRIQMISIESFMPYLVSLCHIELLKYQEAIWHTAKPCNMGMELFCNLLSKFQLNYQDLLSKSVPEIQIDLLTLDRTLSEVVVKS